MQLFPSRCLFAALIFLTVGHQVMAASDPAHQKLTDSQTALTKAEMALKAARARVQTTFESSADYLGATESKKEAQGKFDAASKPILQKLQDDAAFKSAVAKKRDAEARREKLRADPNASPQAMADAASTVLSAAAIVSKLERDALAGDPSIAESRTTLAQSNAKLAELRAGLPELFKSDLDVQAAQKQVDETKTAVAQARKELAAQQAAQAQSQSQQINSSGGGGYGGGMSGGRKR